jgi:hypothetical protein
MRIVPVAMDHGIHDGLANRHSDLDQVVFVHTGTLGQGDRQLFSGVDTLQSRVQKTLDNLRFVAVFLHTWDGLDASQSESTE